MDLLPSFIVHWLVLAFALWVTDKALNDFEVHGGAKGYLVVAAWFGVLHKLLGWFFYAGLFIASFGLALLFDFITKLVITAIVLLIVSKLTSRLRVASFWSGLWAALIMAVTTSVVDWLFHLLNG